MGVNDASRIKIDDSRVMLQIVSSLTANSRDVIYDPDMFAVQNTGCEVVFTTLQFFRPNKLEHLSLASLSIQV
jgi:hypothetical protein